MHNRMQVPWGACLVHPYISSILNGARTTAGSEYLLNDKLKKC